MKLQADALLGIIGEFGVIERSVRAFENGRRIYSDAGEFTLLNCFNSNGDRHAENHQVVENPGAIDCQSQIFRVRRPEQLPGTENKPGGIECNKNAVRFDDVPVDVVFLNCAALRSHIEFAVIRSKKRHCRGQQDVPGKYGFINSA